MIAKEWDNIFWEITIAGMVRIHYLNSVVAKGKGQGKL